MIAILLTASRGTLLTKSAEHTRAISSANRHAWLLARLIALVCAGLNVLCEHIATQSQQKTHVSRRLGVCGTKVE